MKLVVGWSLLFVVASACAATGASSGPHGSPREALYHGAPRAPREGGEKAPMEASKTHEIVFATFAETPEQLEHALVWGESVRTFGAAFAEAPIRIWVPPPLAVDDVGTAERLATYDLELRTSHAPASALRYYFARKVYAAAAAEREATEQARILAWMDEDTVVLREPELLRLEPEKVLAYRPIMHNRSGSALDAPPDPFWARIYEVLEIPESAFFPMVTPADQVTIRPYFNAGLLVVRPEAGILQRWAECFEKLQVDPEIVKQCAQDTTRRIFLHQTALVGAVLVHHERDQLLELPSTYNYPLFFQELFGANDAFLSLEEAVTIRYDVYFRQPAPDWTERTTGPEELVQWLADHLDPR